MKFSSFTKRYHATSFAAISRPCASSGVLMASWFLNSILLNGRVRFCGFSSLYTKSVPISLLCFKSSGLNSISCVCSHSTSAPSFGMLLRHCLFAKMKSPATPFSKLALCTNLPFSKLHLHSKSPEMPTKFCEFSALAGFDEVKSWRFILFSQAAMLLLLCCDDEIFSLLCC